MPIYEFKCNECSGNFEQLCRVDWEGEVKCPSCGAANLTKILSRFSSPGGAGGGCGSCASKNCGSCK
ncbi:MAG TPA: zinc ribbon domain-containing protein [Selenomonadales bacterium]|nr:zinc ribbon domain-containing protein [Selenomonadales bacterium]